MIAYKINVADKNAEDNIAKMLIKDELIQENTLILCLGTGFSVADLLGPLTGTLINKNKKSLNISLCGTLNSPIHTLNIESNLENFKKDKLHILTIDSVLSFKQDVGHLYLRDHPITYGKSSKTNLPLKIGNTSINCIVADKLEYTLLEKPVIKLKEVYTFAKVISNSIIKAKRELHNKKRLRLYLYR
ncbi:spore protease YyaC [Clostridium sp. CX1]|uniref:spore protease YyaC n=1 Tax=Clostridium sp. CX1 TaxID=2978346 RepID=UPI0021BE3A24|nr:spore protease YyaC [Clostridium sp. CX1]MCT8975417.1 spore protease YyaC [Clostridium sp. CX1]